MEQIRMVQDRAQQRRGVCYGYEGLLLLGSRRNRVSQEPYKPS